MPATILPTCSL